MTLINLTEEYLRTTQPSLYKRFAIARRLDMYYASSLFAIEEHFREDPPKKRLRRNSYLSASIVIYGVELKRLHPDSFDEEDGVSLQGLDNGHCTPSFELQDETTKRIVRWVGGNSHTYLAAQAEFGFNTERFVEIPRIFLRYEHTGPRGILGLRKLDHDRKKQKVEGSTLADKIRELMPDFSVPLPQLGY